jgi:hypothetical protein
MTGSVCVSRRVVEAVAETAGVATADLDVRLQDVIDADSLDRLFSTRSAAAPDRRLSLVFRYLDYRVRVTDDESAGVTVTVTPVDEPS